MKLELLNKLTRQELKSVLKAKGYEVCHSTESLFSKGGTVSDFYIDTFSYGKIELSDIEGLAKVLVEHNQGQCKNIIDILKGKYDLLVTNVSKSEIEQLQVYKGKLAFYKSMNVEFNKDKYKTTSRSITKDCLYRISTLRV